MVKSYNVWLRDESSSHTSNTRLNNSMVNLQEALFLLDYPLHSETILAPLQELEIIFQAESLTKKILRLVTLKERIQKEVK